MCQMHSSAHIRMCSHRNCEEPPVPGSDRCARHPLGATEPDPERLKVAEGWCAHRGCGNRPGPNGKLCPLHMLRPARPLDWTQLKKAALRPRSAPGERCMPCKNVNLQHYCVIRGCGNPVKRERDLCKKHLRLRSASGQRGPVWCRHNNCGRQVSVEQAAQSRPLCEVHLSGLHPVCSHVSSHGTHYS